MNRKVILIIFFIIIFFLFIFSYNKNKQSKIVVYNNVEKNDSKIIQYDKERQFYYIKNSNTGRIIAASLNEEELQIYINQPNLIDIMDEENGKSLDEWENILKCKDENEIF